MNENGNGRIVALDEEKRRRQAEKEGRMNCTKDEAAHIAQIAAMRVTEHMAQQIPNLVGTIVEAALRAYDESVRDRYVLKDGFVNPSKDIPPGVSSDGLTWPDQTE